MANVAKQLNTYAAEMSFGNELPTVKAGDLYSLREYGNVVMGSEKYISEFTGTFLKIAMMTIVSKVFENPFNVFFKKYDYGVGIEEVFVNIAKPQAYDPWGDGSVVWQRVMPDVRSCLHLLNTQFQVKQTVYEMQISEAFYSFESMNEWWLGIIRAINNGVTTTIYSICKYMMAMSSLDSGTATLFLDKTNPKNSVKAMKALSSKLKFPSTLYNRAAVKNFVNKENLYLFVTPEFNAELEVDVLAYMFNVEYGKVDFHIIEVDDFFNHDYDILGNALSEGVPHVFTQTEMNKLENIQAILCSENYLFFYNFKYRQSSNYNQDKLNWNLITTWMGSISTSPFEPAIAMTYETPGTPTGITNPYPSENITVGRMNMFFANDTKLTGQFLKNKVISPVVAGAGLIPVEGKPGWYQASNNKGDKATITYTNTSPSLSLVVNVEVV